MRLRPPRLAPSIACADWGSLAVHLRALESLSVDFIHCDVMDGHFVPNLSFGAEVLTKIHRLTRVPLDTHLMVEQPERWVESYARAGSSRISVHVESTQKLEQTLRTISALGIAAGVAISPATPLSAIEHVLDAVQLVLVMTVNPGFAGQELVPGTIEKIAELRDMIRSRGLDVDIEVDGNVSFENIPHMVAAGASDLVLGTSSLYQTGLSLNQAHARVLQAAVPAQLITSLGSSAPRLLVVGSLNTDLVLELERVPRPGENLVGERYGYVPGGKGGNQAVAAARLGAQVSLVACVGADAHGEHLRSSIAAEGVDTRHLATAEEAPTGLAVISVEKNGENRIVVYPGANMAVSETVAASAFDQEYDAVLLQLEVPDGVVAAVFAAAKAKGIPVVLDAGPARPFDLALVHGVEVLSPNQSEAGLLSGLPCDNLEQAALAGKTLAARSGARAVVIKLGAQGALLVEQGRVTHVPAFQVDAVDPTAAGDAFTAALAVRLLTTRNLRQATSYANAAGALAAQILGAQPSLPTSAAVEAFLSSRREEHRALANHPDASEPDGGMVAGDSAED